MRNKKTACKSLGSKEKECYVYHTKQNLHKHHIYFNKRKLFNKELNIELKKLCQIEFEEKYSHEEFIKEFKKNYL